MGSGLNIKQMKNHYREFNLFIYDISRNYISDSKLRSEWIYLGSHILAMIPSEEGCTPPFPGCDQLPKPTQCGIWGDSVALNWAIIGIAPFLVWAVYNFRKRRTASALIFISGLGIIIFVMSREGKSQEAPTEAVYYYHNDHLGTPKVLTDQNGTIQWEAVMEPFGEIDTFIASNANNPFRFPGQYEDDLTGLYYNHHRYYIPGLGRYNRVDPIYNIKVQSLCRPSGSINPYYYSKNNGIISFDPNGSRTCESGKCPDCPGGSWSSTSVRSAEAGLSILLTFTYGMSLTIAEMYCNSDPWLEISVLTFCPTRLGVSTSYGSISIAARMWCQGAECIEDLRGGGGGISGGAGYGIFGGGAGATTGLIPMCELLTFSFGAGAYFNFMDVCYTWAY